MFINQVSNTSFNGTVWLAGRYATHPAEQYEIANEPDKFKNEIKSTAKGIHFETNEVSFMYAVNPDISVIQTHEMNDRIKYIIAPYNLEYILNAYNAAKGPAKVDIRGAGKETY